jgi:hypothetical protein
VAGGSSTRQTPAANSGTAVAPIAMPAAHQRQPGEGSDPVGVSSRTKPTRASPTTVVAGL